MSDRQGEVISIRYSGYGSKISGDLENINEGGLLLVVVS